MVETGREVPPHAPALPAAPSRRESADLEELPRLLEQYEGVTSRLVASHDALRDRLEQLRREFSAATGPGSPEGSIEGLRGLPLQDVERLHIEGALRHHGGHRQRTADSLGIGVRTLRDKIKRWGLKVGRASGGVS